MEGKLPVGFLGFPTGTCLFFLSLLEQRFWSGNEHPGDIIPPLCFLQTDVTATRSEVGWWDDDIMQAINR